MRLNDKKFCKVFSDVKILLLEADYWCRNNRRSARRFAKRRAKRAERRFEREILRFEFEAA